MDNKKDAPAPQKNAGSGVPAEHPEDPESSKSSKSSKPSKPSKKRKASTAAAPKDTEAERNEAKIICNNLNTLVSGSEHNNTDLAKAMGVGVSTITGYLNYGSPVIPKLLPLIRLCNSEEFKDYGLTLDKLVSKDFSLGNSVPDPSIFDKSPGSIHSDYCGVYFCLFFDQTKEPAVKGDDIERDLRYGIITLFNEKADGCLVGHVMAAFFKEKEFDLADNLRTELLKKFNNGSGGNIPACVKGGLVQDCYSETKVQDESKKLKTLPFYTGQADFLGDNVFIRIACEDYADEALIVLYTPEKRSVGDYIGGMGLMASMTHGRKKAPCCQRLIISRDNDFKDSERIREALCMKAPDEEKLGPAAREIAILCADLYGAGNFTRLKDEDKTQIVIGRLKSLVADYLRASCLYADLVTNDDDRAALDIVKSTSAPQGEHNNEQ